MMRNNPLPPPKAPAPLGGGGGKPLLPGGPLPGKPAEMPQSVQNTQGAMSADSLMNGGTGTAGQGFGPSPGSDPMPGADGDTRIAALVHGLINGSVNRDHLITVLHMLATASSPENTMAPGGAMSAS
ncbi:MAG: hypothetical protein KGL39_37005 [Patescibacteria group bacterium]|nr:hypothetical protein [Patescibacteria group bacterium]